MNYAIYLLESALRDEIQAHAHATEWFQGNHSYSDKIGLAATDKAFQESQKIAEERIPQLQSAIAAICEGIGRP